MGILDAITRKQSDVLEQEAKTFNEIACYTQRLKGIGPSLMVSKLWQFYLKGRMCQK